jgi:nucleoside-diphosphate-sugar epimerase
MHVVVTGASSFVGLHLIRSLMMAGVRVTATARRVSLVSDLFPLGHERLKVVHLDWVRNYENPEMPETVDAIVHLAGVTREVDFTSRRAMLESNVTGTINVIRYAQIAQAKRIVFASSVSVYGNVSDRVIDENTKICNPNVYGASKLVAERLFASCEEWLPCVAIRLPGVLGKGAHSAWIPTVLDRARMGETLRIYNPAEPFNNAVHVADIGDFFSQLLQGSWSGFHAFPVGAAGSVSIREVVDLVTHLNKQSVHLRIEPPPQSSFTISSAYAIQRFGYSPMNIATMLMRYASETA